MKGKLITTALGVGALLMAGGMALAQGTPGWYAQFQLPDSGNQPWDETFYANTPDYINDAPSAWRGIAQLGFVTDSTKDSNGLTVCPRALATVYDPRWLINKEAQAAAMSISAAPDPGIGGGTCNNPPYPAEFWTINISGFSYANCTKTKGTGSVLYTWVCSKSYLNFFNTVDGSNDVFFFAVTPADYGKVDFQVSTVPPPFGGYQWTMWFPASDTDSQGNENTMNATELFPFPNPNAVDGM